MAKANQILYLIFAVCLASAIATDYKFTNTAGGSWGTAQNWIPEGVPGANDNVLFTYLDHDNQMEVTLDGDITVNSLTIDTRYFLFKTGSLTVQNDCLVNAAIFYKINITLNGNSTFESTGSGGLSGIMCDSCLINVKDSLDLIGGTNDGNIDMANKATVVVWPGATTTIWYDALQTSMVNPTATLINYGTLYFGAGYTFGNTPWGTPPLAETGPWAEFRNYGDVSVLIRGSPIGAAVYNEFQVWNFIDGKITLKVVQPSSTNADGRFSSDDEFNDAIGPSGTQDALYELHIGGDVHFIFAQAEVLPGHPDKPFNPKVGDFFPVFLDFEQYTGQFRKITWEGLGSGMALGRMTRVNPDNSYFHVGVVICAESDSECINGAGVPPGVETPSSSQSPSGSTSPSTRTPSNSITASASFVELSLMAVVGLVALQL